LQGRGQEACRPFSLKHDWIFPMNIKWIAYWLVTGLLGAGMLAGGAFDIFGGQKVTEGMARLGYPTYFGNWLGAWKIAGAIVVLLPGFKVAKEWAYTGFFINLGSASLAHAMVNDSTGEIVTPLVGICIVVASWYLRPASRKVADLCQKPIN
jgi:hypothetical protein